MSLSEVADVIRDMPNGGRNADRAKDVNISFTFDGNPENRDQVENSKP